MLVIPLHSPVHVGTSYAFPVLFVLAEHFEALLLTFGYGPGSNCTSDIHPSEAGNMRGVLCLVLWLYWQMCGNWNLWFINLWP